MLVTANVTLATDGARFDTDTEHVPLFDVVHEADPLAPPLHEPVTTAPLTFAWVLLWTRIVTLALQSRLVFDAVPSRSATCIVLAGGGAVVTVIETVAVLLTADPSVALYPKASGPL